MSLPTTESGAPLFGAGEDLVASEPFAFVAYYTKDRQYHTWEFAAYTDPGAGALFSYSSAGETQSAQVRAATRLLLDAVVEDDEQDAPPVPDDQEPPAPEAPAVLGYLTSKERFRRIMNSPDWRVSSKVLIELGDWLAKKSPMESSGRPTPPPAR